MATMLQLKAYMLRYGLFRKSQLAAPAVYPIARLQLPQLAIYHFAPVDGIVLGPQASDPLLRTVTGQTFVDHVVKYIDPIGNPQRTYNNPAGMITEFRKRNRVFRPLKNLERLENDTRSLVVINYAMLSHIVKYSLTFRQSYYRWFNVQNQVMQHVNELAKISSRAQFIEFDLPDAIPSLTTLRNYGARQSSDTFKHVRTPEAMMLADVFLWAGTHRHESLLGRIEPKYYDRVNLLVRRQNGWVVLNLGWLNQFRKVPDTELKDAAENGVTLQPNSKGYDAKVFQLMLLRLLSQLHQATSPIDTPTKDAIVAEPLVEENEHDAQVDQLDMDLEDDKLQDTTELVDEIETIAKLEKELDELDRLKDQAGAAEETDEDGNRVENKVIDIDVLSTREVAVKADGSAMLNKADELGMKGLLTRAEHSRLVKLADAHKTILDPYGTGELMVEASKVTDEDLIIVPKPLTDDPHVLDKSMLQSRVDAMDKQYVSKVLKKDIMRCVMAMQKSPVAVTGYSIDVERDATTHNEIHTIKFAPAVGKPSTVKFPVPVVTEAGEFLYKGTNYHMRKQRTDLPYSKVSPTRVALSSYYAKVFIDRTARKKFDTGTWFRDKLVERCRDVNDPIVSKGVISSVPDHRADVPLIYYEISKEVASFTVGDNVLFFDYRRRLAKFDYTDAEKAFEKPGWVLVGRGKKGALLMDPTGMVYTIVGKELEDLGTVFQLTDIMENGDDTPVDMVEMAIYSKTIPVGIALAYLLGLEGLMKKLKVKARRVLVGERLNLQPSEFSVRFKNESLVFDRSDKVSSMLFSGFNLYKDALRNYDIGLFDEKDVYSAVFDKAGVGSRYLRELDSMNTLFIDPITEDLLEWMHEPTTYVDLLIRATTDLQNAKVEARRKDKNKLVESKERVRGYERIAGVIYETLSKAVRSYNARASTGSSSITINPNDITNAIIKDPTCSPVNNINPIHSLREREVITFGGRGGRSRRAMVAAARLFTDEDMGFISEGTVDSGDVAIITYLSPNSNLTTARGTVRMFDKERDGISSILSTPALLSFGADGDDPKRINFINVQHGHGIAVDGYEVPAARTGMERVIASRMAEEFAVTAKGPGEIIEMSPDHIVVKYDDGEVGRHSLGLVHTMAEGSYYPNQLVSGFKVGDKVKQFDVILYNKGFFKPSPTDPKRVDYMSGCIARVALREATYTVEDSSSLSVAFATRMRANVSKVKDIVVSFDQVLENVKKVGDTVDLDTILCTMKGAVSSDIGLYGSEDEDILSRYSGTSARGGVVGVIAKVEVFYNGEVEEMSDSLQELVVISERERRRLAKRLGHEYITGAVSRNVRIGGANLEDRQAVILYYITTPVAMGIGDKLVIGNQMKSTVGEILFGDNRTLESHEEIDIIFGAKSCVDRIVTGPFTGGTTNTVSRYIGEAAYEMMFGSSD